MELADELLKLSQLHRQGALSDSEYEQAKAAVLGRHSAKATQPDDIQNQLEEITRQQEAARIDREWEREREGYLMTGRAGGGKYGGGYSYQYVPTVGGAIWTGLVAVFGGVLWMGFVFSSGGGAFGLFGLVFLVFGLGFAFYQYTQAVAYEQAEADYKRRRARALAGEKDGPGAFFDRWGKP